MASTVDTMNRTLKPRKQRKRFTAFQLDILEDAFQKEHYLTTTMLSDLHARLQLNTPQIRIWFRDRRRKWRRSMEKECKAPFEFYETTLKNKNLAANTSTPALEERSLRSPPLMHIFPVNDRITPDKYRIRRLRIIDLKCSQSNCSSRFKTKAEVNRHLLIVHNIYPYPCRALGCKMSFIHSRQLAAHTVSAHTPKKKDATTGDDQLNQTIWQCPHCMKGFRYSAYLRSHIVRLHEEGSFACAYDGCNFVAPKYRDELKRHVWREHTESKYACGEPGCTKTFKTRPNAQIHRFIHLNRKTNRSIVNKSQTKGHKKMINYDDQSTFNNVSSDTNEEPLDLSIKKIDIQKETEIRNWILSITDEQINSFDPLIMRTGSPTPSVKCASSIFADLITNLRFQNSNV